MPQSNNIPKLSDQSDVTITSPADNDVLAYDSGTGKVINQTAAQAGLAAASHTHTASQVTDFTEASQDVIGALLVDSSTIDMTYNDGSNSFTMVVLTSGLDAMVGDSGSGGTKGLAPAPSSGDAAAGKFLKADGTWAVPSGGSGSSYWVDPCLCATSGNVNLAGGGLANGTTHGGQAVTTGKRVLVWQQSNHIEDGIYLVPATGAASRSADLPAGFIADNVTVKVSRGDYADKQFSQTANGCTVGTDAQTWQVDPIAFTGDSGSGGAGGGVPAPSSGDAAAGKYLGAGGTWSVPSASVGAAYRAINFLRNSTFEFMSRQIDPTASYNVSNDVYGPDGWNVLTEASTIAVQRVAGTNARYAMGITNGDGTAKRLGLQQMLEASDSFQFRGQTVIFNCRVKCSEASKNLRVALVEWTGTGDSITSDIVNSWVNGTFTGGNFFKSSNLTIIGTTQITCTSGSTWYSGSISGSVSSSCNNLMAFVFSESTIGASESIFLECPGLYYGSSVPSWNPLPTQQEKARCQRFIQSFNPQYLYGNKYYANGIKSADQGFPVTMRTTPTGSWIGWSSVATTTPSSNQVAVYGRVTDAYLTVSGTPTLNTAFARGTNLWYAYINSSGAWSGSVGELAYFEIGSACLFILDAEL